MKKNNPNKAKCLLCEDIIQSLHRHDFVSCSCGNIFVDGGFDYFRFGWIKPNSYEIINENKEIKEES